VVAQLSKGGGGASSPDEAVGGGFGFNSGGGAPVGRAGPGAEGGKVVLMACVKRKRRGKGERGRIGGERRGESRRRAPRSE
jgi:hypothetical protein